MFKSRSVLVAALAILAFAAACGAPAPTPEVVTVVETVVVEKEVEKVVTQEVEVEKVVTKEVEVEKVVTATPSPTPLPTATAEPTQELAPVEPKTTPIPEQASPNQLGYTLIETSTVQLPATNPPQYAEVQLWVRVEPVEFQVNRSGPESRVWGAVDVWFIRSDGLESHRPGGISPEVMADVAEQWSRPLTLEDFAGMTSGDMWSVDVNQTALFTVDDVGLVWTHHNWVVGFDWTMTDSACKAGGVEVACDFFMVMPAGLAGFMPDHLINLVNEAAIRVYIAPDQLDR